MVQNSKATPKSCSCRQCRRGKRSSGGKASMRSDERAYRRAFTMLLSRGVTEDDVTPPPAPSGTYYD